MIQQAQEIARVTLANCEAFQELLDVDSELGTEGAAAEALLKIYHDALPSPESQRAQHTRAELEALRPCAIVFTEDSQGWVVTKDAAGAENCWNASGVIHFVIFRNVPAADEYNPSKVDTDFRTIIGNIASEIIGISETAPFLAANKITVSGPDRTPINQLSDIGDCQMAELVVNWGPSE